MSTASKKNLPTRRPRLARKDWEIGMSRVHRKQRPAPALLPSAAGLIGWLAITFAVAYFGSRFEPGQWYAGLDKPSWTPPGAVFPPVWTFLYASMAFAAWLVWRRYGFHGAGGVLGLFLLQLALNGVWSWLFFGQHLILPALIDIAALLIAITVCMVLFRRRVALAGWLFVPYVLWVAYATALNFALWRLN